MTIVINRGCCFLVMLSVLALGGNVSNADGQDVVSILDEFAKDWPCYKADAARSGVAYQELKFPLHLCWAYVPRQLPQLAWPYSVGRGQTIDFDHAHHPVIANRIRGGPKDDQILGNGRMISRWPIRSGVLAIDGVVYFIAGMWPAEGIFAYALDVESGKVIWCNDTSGSMFVLQPSHLGSRAMSGVTPQGYMLSFKDTLYVPSGLAIPSSFDLRTGKLQHYILPWENDWVGNQNVKLQGKTVLKDFDVVEQADGKNRALGKEFKGIHAVARIVLELVPKVEVLNEQTTPIISGMEVGLQE